MFHTFFYGPFGTEDDCAAAIATLDKADEYWDYDCFCIIYGADPLPSDFAFGFPLATKEIRQSIEERAGRPK